MTAPGKELPASPYSSRSLSGALSVSGLSEADLACTHPFFPPWFKGSVPVGPGVGGGEVRVDRHSRFRRRHLLGTSPLLHVGRRAGLLAAVCRAG